MEKIVIKNFGPIKDVEVQIKDINIFIGHTSSGKSTVAKLVGILQSIEIYQIKDLQSFKRILKKYNIDFEVSKHTYISYESKFCWRLKDLEVSIDHLTNLQETISIAKAPLRTTVWEKSSVPINGMQALSVGSLWDRIERIDRYINGKNSENDEFEGILKSTEIARNDLDRLTKIGFHNFSKEVQDAINSLNELFKNSNFNHLLYIPAERMLLSMVAGSIFNILRGEMRVASCIKDFGAEFESARSMLEEFSIPFFKATYRYDQQENNNYISFEGGLNIKLEKASSGIQSVAPLLLTIEANSKQNSVVKTSIIVEEPELNLYPIVQKELTEFVIERVNKSKNKLIITTHSPYILTSLDNLIQADNAAKVQPASREKIASIVPEAQWIDFNRVACYFFENGTCHSTLDIENQSIGASNIDDVSEALGKTFDQLLELKYSHVS
ncbi:MAG: AAA family ATPase [Cyclobacteriaceae bacterium]